VAELPILLSLEVTFDLLTAAAGVVVIVLALRAAPMLILSTPRGPLWGAVGAAALIVLASQVAEVSAAFSRVSTVEDVIGEFADLAAMCTVGLILYLRNRVEKKGLSGLRRAADVDHLTGLGNRSFLYRMAEPLVELYKRSGLSLACVMLDVDDFKSLNDRNGHKSGDKALRCVACVVRESTRADDVVARYGGDEFVVLMGGSVEDAIKVAERVRERVEYECIPQHEASLPRSITVSLGIAPLTEAAATLEELVEAADGELSRAKKGGKNRVAAIEKR
jgi:diguanylate cyclase (GGDEF)-like protein